MSQQDLDRLRSCAHPVIFKTGFATTPFAIKGTCFFASYRRMAFVITAGHVVRDFPPQRLLFSPTGQPKYPARISSWWHVQDLENDPDSSDLFLVRVSFSHLPRKVKARGRTIFFEAVDDTGWFDERFRSNFFLFGFPSQVNEADYTTNVANTGQAILTGAYEGPGDAHGTHLVRIRNPLNLDFNGLSGSPVYSIQSTVGSNLNSLRF